MRESLRVAVATCAAVPDLDGDGPALLGALAEAGATAEARVWDDAGVDWVSYDLVLVRSTWDYTLRRQEFLIWAAGCRSIANPAPVLVWNTDKRYLRDLESAGVPVVPTLFLEPGQPYRIPSDWSGDVVVKPAVSASAADTGRYPSGSSGALELLTRLHRDGRVVMAQPYLPAIEAQGETSLVYLAGRFSHAVRRSALLTGYGTRSPVVGDAALAGLRTTAVSMAQVNVAEAALQAVSAGGRDLTYARVDLVPGPYGEPLLLELELVEPSLFLGHADPEAVASFAAAVVAQARAASLGA